MIGQDSLEELEETLITHMDSVINQITHIPEFIEYNNYLQDKTNIKKSTDKQLKTLTIKMKGDKNDKHSESTERKGKPIRRKLSF